MPIRKSSSARRFSVVLVSCPEGAAEKIARAVMKARAAACVNIVPGVRSIYIWKGRVEEADESLLLIKTTSAKVVGLERVVAAAHPYEVPEIVAVPITQGDSRYLDWVAESVQKFT